MAENQAPFGLIVFMFTTALLPILIPIVKWFWLHPRVNAEKLKRLIGEANEMKERLAQADELLLDLDLANLKKRNIRVKGIRVIWSDNVSGQEKEMHVVTSGDDDMAKVLRSLANEVRKDSTKKLIRICHKLPKRHGDGGTETVIAIHGINDLPRILEQGEVAIHDHITG